MNHRLHVLWIAVVIALTAGPSARPASAADEKTPTHPPTRQVSTEQGSLELSGVKVKKGDLQETVMRQLSQLYQLQRLRSAQGEEDSWLISDKAEPDNYVGVVSFDSGKVRRVARFRKWTQDDDSVELAQRLCDLLEKLTSERGTQASITARENLSGGVSVRGVEMVFGDKRVSFNVVSRGDGAAKQTEVHLDEVIQ
jgi:hypothetical protein